MRLTCIAARHKGSEDRQIDRGQPRNVGDWSDLPTADPDHGLDDQDVEFLSRLAASGGDECLAHPDWDFESTSQLSPGVFAGAPGHTLTDPGQISLCRSALGLPPGAQVTINFWNFNNTCQQVPNRGGFIQAVWSHEQQDAVALLSLAPTAPAAAQRATITINVLEPSRALAKLASGLPDSLNAAVNVIGAAFRHDDSTRTALVNGNYDAYTNGQRQILLDGVERIARGEVPGEELRVRRSITIAFEILATIGLDPAITAPEMREIPGRVLRILRQGDVAQSRSMAVYLLGDLLRDEPPEAPAIIAELVALASAPFSTERPPPQIAVDALINGGEVSIPALRRLNDTDAVQDQNTRYFLKEHARRGYPLIRQGVGPAR